jgi:hypothetical protein
MTAFNLPIKLAAVITAALSIGTASAQTPIGQPVACLPAGDTAAGNSGRILLVHSPSAQAARIRHHGSALACRQRRGARLVSILCDRRQGRIAPPGAIR